MPRKGAAAKLPKRAAPKRFDYRAAAEPVIDEQGMLARAFGVPNLAALLSIDIGPRNMGMAVLQIADNKFTKILHEDLFPEPEKKAYTANELADRMHTHYCNHPELYKLPVWVVELQFIGAANEGLHRCDNMILQGCLQTLAAMSGAVLVIVSPRAVMQFYAMKSKGHEANKEEAVELCDNVLRDDEYFMVEKEREKQERRAKEYAPKRYKTGVDDMANAVLNALYAATKMSGREFYKERLQVMKNKP